MKKAVSILSTKTAFSETPGGGNPELKPMKRNPMPRDGHAAVVLFNSLFIFGGDRHRMSFNDLSILPLNAHILDCH